MIYTITASYGQYEDRCDVRMYMTADLGDCRAVMLGLQQSIVAALTILSVSGPEAVINCAEIVWDLAQQAYWDGQVHLTISSMELGVVTKAEYVEGVIAESIYNGCVYYTPDELPLLTKYEILALPYEQKYLGYRH